MSGGMIAIAGRPGSGKTSLMVDLVGELSRRGLAVSTMMRVDDPASIDRPGKDSFRHRAAGAEEVLVTSAQRWALIHGGGASEHDPLAHMTAVDVVIVEDMAGEGYPMIEVHRAATAAGQPPLGRDDPAILAVVSDAPLEGLDQPVIDLGDAPAVADFIIARLGLA
ncbi:MAG: molybdopterin-guanine dinucleotide biosynthesis protein B [Proteobacteria bacterium]|nr:molybdopterin-guanine dinucleotide biosynthesis protein B [Pseudomonadota bacterium]